VTRCRSGPRRADRARGCRGAPLAGAADDALLQRGIEERRKIVRMSTRIRIYGRRPSSNSTVIRRPSRSMDRTNCSTNGTRNSPRGPRQPGPGGRARLEHFVHAPSPSPPRRKRSCRQLVQPDLAGAAPANPLRARTDAPREGFRGSTVGDPLEEDQQAILVASGSEDARGMAGTPGLRGAPSRRLRGARRRR